MFLISPSTSISRPTTPAANPAALRPPASSQESIPKPPTTNTRSSHMTTPVDDRNILFWRDRMTALEEERNQKGFRPAFVQEYHPNTVSRDDSSEIMTEQQSEDSTESILQQNISQELSMTDSTTTTSVSNEPYTVVAPVVPPPLSTGMAKSPTTNNDIQVVFWRDRMNEQEEERNRHGFRKPESVETEVESTAGVQMNGNQMHITEEEGGSISEFEASDQESHTTPESALTNLTDSNQVDETLEDNEERQEPVSIALMPEEYNTVVAASQDNSEDIPESTSVISLDDNIDHAYEISASEEIHSISDPNLTDTDGITEVDDASASQAEAEPIAEPVAILSTPDTDQVDDIGASEEMNSISESSFMDTTSGVTEVEVDDKSASQVEVEPVSEPAAIAAAPETDRVDEETDLNSESAVMDTGGVTKADDMSSSQVEAEPISEHAAITPTTETDQVDFISEPISLDANDVTGFGDVTASETETKSIPEHIPSPSTAVDQVDDTPAAKEQDSVPKFLNEPTARDTKPMEDVSAPISAELAGTTTMQQDKDTLAETPAAIAGQFDGISTDQNPRIDAKMKTKTPRDSLPTSEFIDGADKGKSDEAKVADASLELPSVAEHTQETKLPENDPATASNNEKPELVNAKSSTKELLQYLFTGSPEGSDEMTDEDVEAYLGEPLPVVSMINEVKESVANGKTREGFNGKINGSAEKVESLAIQDTENGENLLEGPANRANENDTIGNSSTNELLDILFGTTETESNGEDEIRRNGTKETLNGDSTETPENTNTKDGEEKAKERPASSKIREMALFTVKELLLPDRQ